MKSKLRKMGGVSLMILLGVMWAVSGWFGVSRQDPSGYLEQALLQALEQEKTISFYQSFLSDVVIPNKVLFAHLAGWGELLIGISFLSGTLTRVSSLAGIFLLINYGLMNSALLQHFILMVLMVMVFWTKPSRVYGFDKLMHQKRPESSLF